MSDFDPSGIWLCTHWYPSNEQIADDSDTHRMKCHVAGNTLVFESLPQDNGGYMLVRLVINDNIASGSWNETASLTGPYKGAQYSGSGQLIVNPETGNMEGKWAGAGFDHKLKEMRVYSGNWEIVREVKK